jgi:GNAT superfamily N-acetyltransferase
MGGAGFGKYVAIPIIGVEMLDGYRKPCSTHPTKLWSFTRMYKVRPAKGIDAQAVQRIYASCISTAHWLPEQARAAVDFAQSSVGELVHVAVASNGEVVGFISVLASESFVHHLYVHHEARGKGVGRQLLLSLQPWLTAPWRLKCVRANQRALAFYIRFGWREVATGESEHGAYAVLEWGPSRILHTATKS